MKKLTGDSCLLIGIMFFTLAFGLVALTYPEMKTKLVPGVVSGIAFVLAAIQLWKELSQKEQPEKESKADADDDFSEAPVGWRENMVAFAWLAGFLLGIYLVGFHISTLFLVLSYLKLNRLGWAKSIVTAVLATATIYVLFIVVLKADLFPGVITEALLTRF